MRSPRMTHVVAVVLAALVGAVVLSAVAAEIDLKNEISAALEFPETPTQTRGCLITTYRLVAVPAQEPGMLLALHAHEGQEVKAGEVLAQINDDQSQAAHQMAYAKLAAAEAEANNPVNVEYAEASHQVAAVNLETAREANKVTPTTFSQWDIRALALKKKEAELHVRQAAHEQSLAKLKVDVQKAELKAAELDIGRRKVMAPWNGVIERKYREVGDWVKPGDPILQILEMDRLYAQEYMDATRISSSTFARGTPVEVTLPLPGGRQVSLRGQIEVVENMEAPGRKFLVKALVENRKENGRWLAHPGQPGQMKILTK